MRKLLSLFLVLYSALTFAQTRDSLVTRTVTLQTQHDTIRQVYHDTTYVVYHDTTYTVVDTLKIPVILPPIMVKGMYVSPSDLKIGDVTSENSFLAYAQRQGTNELNVYARSFFYTDATRIQLAAFVTKAKTSYGMLNVTIDVRLTNNNELPGITAYFTKYQGTLAMVGLLSEFEPYNLNYKTVNGVQVEDCKYDDKILCGYTAKYNHFYYMLPVLSKLCHQYGTTFGWYQGWIGNNAGGAGIFKQAAVDSMVKYCDIIYNSNYVSEASYTADKWAGGMDKRYGYLAASIGNPRVGKSYINTIEIISLELKKWGAGNDFLGNVFVTHSFYGSTYTDGIKAYNLSTTDVVLRTRVLGRTIFIYTYAKKARP